MTESIPYAGKRRPLENLVSVTGEAPAHDSAGRCDPVD